MDNAAPSAGVGAIYADEKPSRCAVSISSVDSEPIARAASAHSVASSASLDSKAGPRRGWVVPDGDDLAPDLEEAAVLPLTVPLDQISEAPVAAVSSASVVDCSCVAEAAPDTLAMDVGTRLCLADGTCVGCVSSVLGPVRQAFYLIKVTRSDFAELLAAGRLDAGVALHYDLVHQQIMFDPFGQCDAAKGTDASYVNDEELPEHVRPDFSDDEKELEWKRLKRRRGETGSISSDESQEDIEWSRLHLDDDAAAPPPPSDARVVEPGWLRHATR